MTEQFIISTAKDYDMEISEVKTIANKNEGDYNNFYIDLELFIKEIEQNLNTNYK